MRQRRISGILGFSIEGIDNFDTEKRIFWVNKYGEYHILFTKVMQYQYDTSEDPLDQTSGLKYNLGSGEYKGFTWVKNGIEEWTIIYSVNDTLNILKINPIKKQVFEQKSLNIYGAYPTIFYNGVDTYIVGIIIPGSNILKIVKTKDFNTFSQPKSASIYTSQFSLFKAVNKSEITLGNFYEINNYISNTYNVFTKEYNN